MSHIVGKNMDRQLRINKRNKLLRRLFIILSLFMVSLILVREYSLVKQNITYFNEQIYDTAKKEIKQEVDARIEEVDAVKAQIESEYLAEIKHEVQNLDFAASFAVSQLPVTATLDEKREIYVDTVFQFNLYQDDYMFFSLDLDGISYLMSIEKNLEGTNITNMQDGITGSYFIVEMINAIKNSDTNDAVITYNYYKEVGGEYIEKTSYIFYNEEVDLILGMGLYQDDYIKEVQDELFNRISSYNYGIDDYIYIFAFDGSVIYYPKDYWTSEDVWSTLTNSGESLHQIVVDALRKEDSIYVDYYFDFDDLDQYKTGYMARIEDWDIYIGRSFIIEDLRFEQNEYFTFLLPGIIVFNLIMLLATVGVVVIIKTIFSQNMFDIREEFNYKNTVIKKMSYVDYLTGLNNRSYFEEVVHQFASCKKDVGVVMADANGLKLINGAYSHLMGDQILKEIANLLVEIYRDGTVFRWGGDEFLVILEHTSDEELKMNEQTFTLRSKEKFINSVQLSASVGSYVAKTCDEDIYHMINQAEKKMYDHKIFESLSIKRTIIDSLLNTLYNSFNFEKQHSQNVMKYAVMIGEALKFDDEKITKLKLAAQLHDIGKIGIPDYILSKNEPLTDEEFYEIKLHPEKGYRILSAYPDLSEYANYVFYHHERYDGTGYPRGMSGEDIPLFSRVISVADAYDAMTEERVYKKSRTKEEALNEILKFRGTQFDPRIADIFVKIMSQK